MTYTRVAPRDLFNEAKLLNCIGKVALLVVGGQLPGVTMEEESVYGFGAEQDPSDGSLFLTGVQFFAPAGEEIHFFTPLNSRAKWPLMMRYKGEDYHALSEAGEFLPSKTLFASRPDRSE